MKRVSGIYSRATTPEALHKAYLVARRQKRANHSCFEFERHLGANIAALARQLADGSYRPKPLQAFYIHEPKERLIEAPAFRDLVVQHAFYAELMPIFDRRFLSNSFACRTGYGTHACADYVQQLMRTAPPSAWTVHVDVRKFFYSIDREVLGGLLRRVIKCERTLGLMVIFTHRDSDTGIPIGNLLSQMFALIYLDTVDHYIKRELKLGRYARYMDDLILVLNSEAEARQACEAVCAYLTGPLKLGISKAHTAPIARGINFCGFRTWRRTRVIRKYSLKFAARAARKGNLKSFVSCLGHAQQSASYKYLLDYCKEQNSDLYQALPKSHHRAHRAVVDTAARRGGGGTRRAA